MCVEALEPITRIILRFDSVHFGFLYGDRIPIAEHGALLPQKAAVNIDPSLEKLWQPAVNKSRWELPPT